MKTIVHIKLEKINVLLSLLMNDILIAINDLELV